MLQYCNKQVQSLVKITNTKHNGVGHIKIFRIIILSHKLLLNNKYYIEFSRTNFIILHLTQYSSFRVLFK